MSMTIIRSAAPEDAGSIARVHIESWLTTYRGLMPDGVLARRSMIDQQPKWEKILSQPLRTSTVVADDAGEVVGFASFGPEPGNDFRYQGELYAIYILGSHQRQGIGRQLMRAAAQGLLSRHFPNMLLWVLSTNPARQFYEKLGGQHLRDRSVEFDGAMLHEAAYGWPDLTQLALEPEAGPAVAP
jgi:GNAT superfamily N-acetyltransferase